MHMLWRFILTYIWGRVGPTIKPGETTEINMRVMPMDLDFLMHVNNGVYLSYLDHGRMNMIFRNGLYEVCRKNGWYGVVAGESIKFRRSLKVFNKFTVQTTPVGYDDRYFFIQHKIISKGEVMASALVKIAFLKKSGGKVPTALVNAAMNVLPDKKFASLSTDWHGLETKYL